MAENKHEFKAEIKKLLHILSRSLYQHKEIFLRELVSNSSDALKKMHFISLSEKDFNDIDLPLKIDISFDSKNKEIRINDSGVGMTKDELVENLGTIAGSGTQRFLEQLKSTEEKKDDKKNGQIDLDIIGQFGVGFYSVFMVADKVNVITKSYKKGESAWQWESDGSGEFTVTPAERATRGTEIVIFLREDEAEYLSTYRLENIIKKYSNFVPFPIFVSEIKGPEVDMGEDDEKKDEGKEEKTEEGKEEKAEEKKEEKPEPPKPVNEIEPLWKKSAKDITEEQYKNFYHYIAHRYDDYNHVINYNVDGRVQFRSITFIPEGKSQDLMRPEVDYGLALYSKNILIMEKCKELIPQWMRWLKGVVDSEDIPLNVSRDTIQNDRFIMKINELIEKKVISELEDLSEKVPDKYKKIWNEFGIFIKEGIVTDYASRENLLKLLRFYTSKTKSDEMIGLDQYLKNMPADQTEIYYLVGENLDTMKLSPHLGYYKNKGYEVIFFTESIDNFLMMNVHDYHIKEGEGEEAKDKAFTFVPIDTTEKDKKEKKEGEDEEKKDEKEKEEATEELKVSDDVKKFLDQVKEILGEKIVEAKASDKLYGNACRLANPAGGMTSSMQRAMRFWTQSASNKEFQIPKKIMEFDPGHPTIKALVELSNKDSNNSKIKPVVNQLFENCLLAEGDLPNPSLMVPRINQLIEMLITGNENAQNPVDELEKEKEAEKKAKEDAHEKSEEKSDASADENTKSEADIK